MTAADPGETMAKITRERLGEFLHATLRTLKEMGGEGKAGDVLDRTEPKLRLTDYEREKVKSGYVRWRTAVQWYSIDCVKAGYLEKSGGMWRLTKQGEEALALAPMDLFRSANEKYKEWRAGRPPPEPVEEQEGAAIDEERVERQAIYVDAVAKSRAEIERRINDLDPYDFQRLVASLLVGMGYHVPFIAPPGPDGGIDIVAYKDPLGTSTPRIRVQVKHREQKVTVKEVRELEGVLRKDGDMGLIVSSGGFTSEADREIQVSSKHIEKMDLDRVIRLWQEHYARIPESGKKHLPLVPVYFLAPDSEE